MNNINKVLLVLLLFLYLMPFIDLDLYLNTDENKFTNLDIIHIDTGNTKKYKDNILLYDSNLFVNFLHGSEMVESFYSELINLQLYNVKGYQFAISSMDEINFVRYIIALRKVPQLKPKILSISLSGTERMPIEFDYLKSINEQNIITIVAAGNEPNTVQYPASFSKEINCLISVSGLNNGYPDIRVNSGDVYLPNVLNEYGTSFNTARFGAHVLQEIRRYKEYQCENIKQILINKYGVK